MEDIMIKVLKYRLDEHEGYLSVYEENQYLYAIVKKDAPKVQTIEETRQLLVSYDLKNPTFENVFATITYEDKVVKWVYDKLLEQKNLYFKEFNDTLCVVRIGK